MIINKLIFKLTLPLLLIVALMFVFIIPAVLYINTSIMTKQSQEYLSHLSSLTVNQINNEARDLQNNVKLLVDFPQIETALREKDREQLSKILLPAKVNLNLDFIAAVDNEKTPLVFFSNPQISSESIMKADLISRGLMGIHISSLIEMNNKLYTVAVVSSSTWNEPNIIIAGRMLESPELKDAAGASIGREVLLHDLHGRIVSGGKDTIAAHEEIHDDVLEELTAHGKTVIRGVSDRNKIKQMVLYTPLVFDNKVKAFFAIQMPMSEIDTARKEHIFPLVLILSIGLLMLIVAGFYTSKWITGRIGKMLEGTNKIAQGELGYQVSYTAKDELADLTESLNNMSTKLMRSHDWWSSTFDSMNDAVSIHDSNCNIIKVNYAMSRLTGISMDKLIGQKCFKVYHGAEACIDLCPMKTAVNSGIPEFIEVFEPHLDHWLSISVSPLLDQNGEIDKIVHVVRDITERKNAEKNLQTQLEHLNALRSIDKAIIGSIDLNIILDTFLDQVLTQLNIDAACILLLNNKTQILEYKAGKGFHSKALKFTHLRMGESYAGRAALQRSIQSIPNLREDSDGFATSGSFFEEEFVSYIAVPLIAKGQVKGVLELFHRSFLSPDEEWMDFLEVIGNQGAIAVDNATMFDDLQRSNMELSLAYEKTIMGWSHAMDMRDKETEGHSRRVTELTVYIAHEMGIRDEDLVNIRRGALLHDMGKMGIPDSILLKPGKLTEDEWKIMRMHPIYAYRMLHNIDYIRPAIDIPYYHHEKWDGTGYPKGLKGENIPLAARIFAVVDVWDALTSDRPYRSAWSREKTLDYIRSCSGSHFDPDVVKKFLIVMGSSPAQTVQDEAVAGSIKDQSG